MSELLPLGLCKICKAVTSHKIEFAMDGEVFASGHACPECIAEQTKGLEPWRRRFEMLLANGVSRVRANEILIAQMNRAGVA